MKKPIKTAVKKAIADGQLPDFDADLVPHQLAAACDALQKLAGNNQALPDALFTAPDEVTKYHAATVAAIIACHVLLGRVEMQLRFQLHQETAYFREYVATLETLQDVQ